MDKISIPEQDVVPMETVAPDVAGLRVLLVNAYAISRNSGDWALAPALTALARNFDRIARPDHGRYLDRPAA